MAEVNYMNPQGMNPGQSWQPQGFLAGMYYDQQHNDYRNMLGLQQALTGMGVMKQQGELQDYTAARPSALAASIAKNQAISNTAGREAEADTSLKESNADLAKKTLLSNIEAKVSSNDQTVRDNALKGIKHATEVLDLLSPAIATGNTEAVQRTLTQAGVKPDNPVVKDILASSDPSSKLKEYLAAFEQMSGRSTAGNIKLKGGFDIEERKIMADAQKYTADKHLEAAQYRSEHQAHVEKIEGILARSMEQYYAEKDPEVKKKLASKIDQLEHIAYTLKAVGAPYGTSEFRSDVIGGRPTNPSSAPGARANAIVPFSQRAGATQPGSPTNENLQTAAEKAFGSYDPAKYNYRIAPDGVPERKAK